MVVDVKSSRLKSFQVTFQSSVVQRRQAQFFDNVVVKFLDRFSEPDTFQNLQHFVLANQLFISCHWGHNSRKGWIH